MKDGRKKKSRVRTKDWVKHGDDAFTHDLKRHRRTDTALKKTASTFRYDESLEDNAVVVSHAKKWATVEWNDDRPLCRIDEGLHGGDATLLAPGDRVRVELREGDPWIVGVRARASRLSRLAIEGSNVAEQVMAANIDQLIIVVTPAKPAFKPGIVDRFLICALNGNVEPIICMNKMDLVDAPPALLETYAEIGHIVVQLSCESGEGIEALREHLRGKTSVLAGQSGVGKTTILNTIDPSFELPTREVSESTDKGRHTTTGAQLFHLDDAIDIVDTPGIRRLGLWKVTEENLGLYFPEMAQVSAACKFRNCSHIHEPQCAVLEAIESGIITKPRYASYLRIREDLSDG